MIRALWSSQIGRPRGVLLAVSIGAGVVAIGLMLLVQEQRSRTLRLFQEQLDLNEHRTFLTEASATLARAQLAFDRGAAAGRSEEVFNAVDIVSSALTKIRDGEEHSQRRLKLSDASDLDPLITSLVALMGQLTDIAESLEIGSSIDRKTVLGVSSLLAQGYRESRKLAVEMEITAATATQSIHSQLESTLFYLSALATLVCVLFVALAVYIRRLLRTEDRLQKARTDAEEASLAKTEFLAAMSYEIRTPMTGVIGTASMLSESQLSEQQQTHLSTIIRNSERLLGVVDDIIDFSKIDAQLVQVVPHHTDLHELLREVIRLARASHDSRSSLRLDLEVSGDVPRTVSVDEKRLTQVLQKLLSNAIKHADSSGIKLAVRTTNIDNSDTVRVEFAIRDNGIGIAHDRLISIFDEFGRTDHKRDDTAGTGLGLNISKRLAELMNGTLTVESELGLGSTFRLTLPLQPSATPESGTSDQPTETVKRRDLRILVADDNKANRLLDAHMLRQLGYTAEFAENGLEAVHMCEQTQFDIVFMDMQMPVMDGNQATKRIHARINPVPYIVALTVNIQPDQAAESTKLGINEFMTKPLKLNEMRRFLDAFSHATEPDETPGIDAP